MIFSNEDLERIRQARDTIRKRLSPNWHQVGSALRTRLGNIFSAVHLDAHVGGISVRAEALALGMADIVMANVC